VSRRADCPKEYLAEDRIQSVDKGEAGLVGQVECAFCLSINIGMVNISSSCAKNKTILRKSLQLPELDCQILIFIGS
jgi:hypothetical protein